jgi:hypothetical protein
MATLAIEINDDGLVLANASGVLTVEPGVACVDNGVIVTGEAAYAQARLKPRQTSNRYWSQLSLETPCAIDGVRNVAELAYAQLSSLWQRYGQAGDDVVLVVPGYYRGAQLGLLLGLAQECGMPVRAMVDAAAAASDTPYPGRELLYVDAGLHRISITPLQQGDEVSALSEQGLDATGLMNLKDALAKRLAEMFVLSTRFDPLHRAESEQSLYDRLDGWMQLLREQEVVQLSLPHGADERVVEVKRDQWLGVVTSHHRAIVQSIAQTRQAGLSLVVQLSDRLARLPGLTDELARLDVTEIICQPAGHAALAVLRGLDVLPPRGEQVKLLRHLAWRAPAVAAADSQAPRAAVQQAAGAAASRATHVVYRGVVYAVDSAGLLIGRSRSAGRRVIVVEDQTSGVSRTHCELSVSNGELRLRDLSSYGAFVNERRVAGEETLHPGDVIRIGSPGAELQVVTMEQVHGQTP